jgi:hypothetical protein
VKQSKYSKADNGCSVMKQDGVLRLLQSLKCHEVALVLEQNSQVLSRRVSLCMEWLDPA